MRCPILCMAVCVCVLSACQKNAATIFEQEPVTKTVTTSTTDFTKYTISKGEHYTANNAYQPIESDELKFIVLFDSTCIYQSNTEENQFDINKLYGFSDNNAMHHSFSARFGWSWTHNALRLYGYVYNEGVVTSKELSVIPIGKEVSCTIKVNNNVYQFYINGELAGELDRKATTPKAHGYLLYPYFGGDEVAPHNVNIWIKKR